MNIIDKAHRLEMALRAQYLATDSETDMHLYLDMALVKHRLTELVFYSELEHSRYWQRLKKKERNPYGIGLNDEVEEGQDV